MRASPGPSFHPNDRQFRRKACQHPRVELERRELNGDRAWFGSCAIHVLHQLAFNAHPAGAVERVKAQPQFARTNALAHGFAVTRALQPLKLLDEAPRRRDRSMCRPSPQMSRFVHRSG